MNSNQIVTHALVNDIVNDILTKWLSIIEYPRRLVMIRVHWCSICDTTKDTNMCSTCRWDTPCGNNLYGWTYCERCTIYKTLINTYYYKNYTTFIRLKTIKRFIKEINDSVNDSIVNDSDDDYDRKKYLFSFYRKSSNINIKPYIEKGFYTRCLNDFIYANDTNTSLYVYISWNVNSTHYKPINMSNIIFYNRDMFGYEYETFPIKDIPLKLQPLLHKHYNDCKEWYTLECVFNRVHHKRPAYLPFGIQKKIFKYWNNLFIL